MQDSCCAGAQYPFATRSFRQKGFTQSGESELALSLSVLSHES